MGENGRSRGFRRIPLHPRETTQRERQERQGVTQYPGEMPGGRSQLGSSSRSRDSIYLNSGHRHTSRRDNTSKTRCQRLKCPAETAFQDVVGGTSSAEIYLVT